MRAHLKKYPGLILRTDEQLRQHEICASRDKATSPDLEEWHQVLLSEIERRKHEAQYPKDHDYSNMYKNTGQKTETPCFGYWQLDSDTESLSGYRMLSTAEDEAGL